MLRVYDYKYLLIIMVRLFLLIDIYLRNIIEKLVYVEEYLNHERPMILDSVMDLDKN